MDNERPGFEMDKINTVSECISQIAIDVEELEGHHDEVLLIGATKDDKIRALVGAWRSSAKHFERLNEREIIRDCADELEAILDE